MEVTLFLFLLNPKYYQNKIWSNTSVSFNNLFLAQCWRLETRSRPFYNFNRMTLEQDLAIFSS